MNAGRWLVVFVALVLALAGDAVAQAGLPLFRDGFETLPPGTVVAESRQPAPGSVLPATAVPTIAANFLSFPAGTTPAVAVSIDGVPAGTPVVTEDGFRLPLDAPLPEGTHEVEVRIGAGTSPVVARWGFTTRTRPAITSPRPFHEVVGRGAHVVVGADFSDPGAGIDVTTARILIDGEDRTASATVGPDGIQLAQVLDNPGERLVRVIVADLAGNVQETDWVFYVGSEPEVQFVAPVGFAPVPAGEPVLLDVRIDGRGELLDAGSIRLFRDGHDVTAAASITLANDGATARVQSAWTDLDTGGLTAQVDVLSQSGVPGSALRYIAVATVAADSISLPGLDGTTTLEPRLEVRAEVRAAADPPTSVTINGIRAVHAGVAGDTLVYRATVPLAAGTNTITAVARFPGGIERSATAEVLWDAPPVLTIDSPSDFAVLGPLPEVPGNATQLTGTVARPVTLAGRSTRPLQSVRVNQQQATLGADGTTFRFESFFLREGTNVLTAVGTDLSGREASTSITVYVDHTAPIVLVQSPPEGHATTDRTVEVAGVAHDVVAPLVGARDPVVRIVNRANGEVRNAAVSQRRFRLRGLPLVVGLNRIDVIAEDAAGNERRQERVIVRTLGGVSRLIRLSGDGQSGPVDSLLPAPLEVLALDAAGDPIPGQSVQFHVARGSGSLSLPGAPANFPDGVNPARTLTVTTDGSGRAAVSAMLGQEAGPGAHQVVATSPTTPGQVMFSADASPLAARDVLADGLPSSQFVAAGSSTIEPLTATVVDTHHNRIPDVALEYRIRSGQARILVAPDLVVAADGQSARVMTDREGVASIRVLVAPDAVDAVVVDAALADGGASPPAGRRARFDLMVLPPRTGPTRFSGLVMDHSGVPRPGVRVSIERTPLSVVTDDRGRFVFEGQVPAGKIDLHVDGRLADAGPGRVLPGLHFEATVVPGQDNQLPHAIHLPPVDVASAVVVGGEDDVQLEVPGWEGLSMRVRAHSVTFPDGSRVGPLTVSMVHADRLPMVPQGGSSGFGTMGWTIQPSGTRFDPPIEVTMPNTTAMRPGATLAIQQWDHDLATFVPMGLGTVSEDGSRIVTEPGTGISKAGWGGGPPPIPPNDGDHDPPECPVRVLAGEDCPCTVSSLEGACIARYDVPERYQVTTDTPGQVTWTVGPNGNPATGSGSSLEVGFGRIEGKFTYRTDVAAQCPEPDSVPVRKEVGVAAECSVYEPLDDTPVLDPGQALNNNPGHGQWGAGINPGYPVRGCITPGNRWTHRINRIEVTYNISVPQDPGPTYLSGPDDPLITRDNCVRVLRDLKPVRDGSPYPWPMAPYEDYVPLPIVRAHEQFHQDDFVEKVVEPFSQTVRARMANFGETECAVENPYQEEHAFSEPEVKRLSREFCGGSCTGLSAAHERRAYADEAVRLEQWRDAIRARAVQENWERCD